MAMHLLHVSPTDYYLGTGTVLAVVLVLVLVLVVMLVGVVMYRRKRRKAGSADRVSFENPSYLREMNLENLQVCSDLESCNLSLTGAFCHFRNVQRLFGVYSIICL